MMLAGKIAMVTGGTSGIGLATARRLADDGAHAVLVGRRPIELDGMSGAVSRLESMVADLSRPHDIHALFEAFSSRHPRLDILVINAGVSHAPALPEMTLEAYEQLMDVNVKGAVFTFVHALPTLAQGATVVFTGSVAGRKGRPGDALYAGSKGGGPTLRGRLDPAATLGPG